MTDTRTTWWGAIGEAMKAAAPFVPPPFNLIPLGLGAMCTAIAFYFAKDKEPTVVKGDTRPAQ